MSKEMIEEQTNFEYSLIRPDDFLELKTLHEQLLPVHYSDKFYEEACLGFGIQKAPLFSIIVRKGLGGEMVGFLLAQFMSAAECEDVDLLMSRHAEPVDEVQEAEAKVMYILTLGCREECRRQGLATVMVQRCLAHGREDPLCGAVYLHVVEYNEAALRFYEKNEFVSLRTLYSFYIIDGQAHTAYLYIHYMNGYSSESVNTLLHRAVIFTDSVFSAALSWFSIAVSSVFNRMGAGAANPGQWLAVGSAAGAGAMLQGTRGAGERADDKV